MEVKQSDGVSYHLPSNAKTIILFQVRDRVFRRDQPDMDRSLWYVYVSMVTVPVSSFMNIDKKNAHNLLDAAWGVE